MNGIVEIQIDGKKHVLRFGYHGCMEFERRLFKNTNDNNAKILTDLIYAGMFGEAMRSEKAVPDYADAYDLHESLAEEENYAEQSEKVWTVYNESKYGKDFQKRLAEFKKKAEDYVKESEVSEQTQV